MARAPSQAEMDSWAADELALPTVPTPHFTTPYDLRPAQLVTAQLRKELTALPASVAEVDMLVCDSAPRVSGDFSLWFSLRYAVATVDKVCAGRHRSWPHEQPATEDAAPADTCAEACAEACAATVDAACADACDAACAYTCAVSRVEPNLLDTGFTFMYYPPPVNFTNEFVTGGPLQGGTHVVIDGSGFIKGYRNESDIDLSMLIVRCRFTDKPSLVSFRQSPPQECDDPTGVTCPECDAARLTIAFDFDTNGPELDFGFGAGFFGSQQMLDQVLTFHDPGGAPVRLGESLSSRWESPRHLAITLTNTEVWLDSAAGAAAVARASPGAGVMVRLQPEPAQALACSLQPAARASPSPGLQPAACSLSLTRTRTR